MHPKLFMSALTIVVFPQGYTSAAFFLLVLFFSYCFLSDVKVLPFHLMLFQSITLNEF